MGNLPTARTETCINGAPVNPNLINEIQDVLIATYNGPVSLVGPVTFIGPLILNSIALSGALPGGTTNNLAPTGLATANVLRSNTSATGAATVTGLSAGSAGQVLALVHSGPDNLILTHEDAGSTAANRFLLPNSASITIRPNGSVMLWYEGASSRWRVLSAF